MRPTDAAPLGRILRDRLVTRFLPERVHFETGRHFVDRVLREQRAGDGRAFAIVWGEAEEVIGQVRLMNWSYRERQAEIGYWLGRRWWGRGFATESVRLVCRYGFRTMGLHRIRASVVQGNAASTRVLVKLGFVYEGTSRDSARAGSRWRNTDEYGLLQTELRGGWIGRVSRAASRTRP